MRWKICAVCSMPGILRTHASRPTLVSAIRHVDVGADTETCTGLVADETSSAIVPKAGTRVTAAACHAYGHHCSN